MSQRFRPSLVYLFVKIIVHLCRFIPQAHRLASCFKCSVRFDALAYTLFSLLNEGLQFTFVFYLFVSLLVKLLLQECLLIF